MKSKTTKTTARKTTPVSTGTIGDETDENVDLPISEHPGRDLPDDARRRRQAALHL
jgi:hypothetical protein